MAEAPGPIQAPQPNPSLETGLNHEGVPDQASAAQRPTAWEAPKGYYEKLTNDADILNRPQPAVPRVPEGSTTMSALREKDKDPRFDYLFKPTQDADYLGYSQELMKPLTPEQREALAKGSREFIKQRFGVTDSADLTPGVQKVLDAFREWIEGKAAK